MGSKRPALVRISISPALWRTCLFLQGTSAVIISLAPAGPGPLLSRAFGLLCLDKVSGMIYFCFPKSVQMGLVACGEEAEVHWMEAEALSGG